MEQHRAQVLVRQVTITITTILILVLVLMIMVLHYIIRRQQVLIHRIRLLAYYKHHIQ